MSVSIFNLNVSQGLHTCLLLSCSGLWMVYMTQDPGALPPFRSFPITLFSEFEVSIGLIDLPVDHTIYTHPVVHCLHVCFSVLSYMLLFNFLIAMMSDTQWRVTQERDELWRVQVGSVVSTRLFSETSGVELWRLTEFCFYLFKVVATILMLERRFALRLWPRLGVCGLSYGLGERWYLR